MDKKSISKIIHDNIKIIIDTREKKYNHISSYLDKNNINYLIQKLDVGDYSFTFNDVDFLKDIIIERKSSLDEIVNNFIGSNRDRFEREFLRMTTGNKYLLIEGATWEKIYRHGYRSKFPPESLAASIFTFQHRFNVNTIFASKEYTPNVIYGVFFYYIREKILNNEVVI